MNCTAQLHTERKGAAGFGDAKRNVVVLVGLAYVDDDTRSALDFLVSIRTSSTSAIYNFTVPEAVSILPRSQTVFISSKL